MLASKQKRFLQASSKNELKLLKLRVAFMTLLNSSVPSKPTALKDLAGMSQSGHAS